MITKISLLTTMIPVIVVDADFLPRNIAVSETGKKSAATSGIVDTETIADCC
jgi:hypothetical protein